MNRTFDRHIVLCVDDEPEILSSLRRALQREPYELLTTESPEAALRWVSTQDISLVITDQRMPEMEGSELLERISRRSPSTARIILTAFPESTIATPGLRRQTDCMISKPWDTQMLRRTVRQLLHDRTMDLIQEEAGQS